MFSLNILSDYFWYMATAALTILSLFFRNWNGRDLLSGKKATTMWQLVKNRQNHSLLCNKEFVCFFVLGSWYRATETLGISQVMEILLFTSCLNHCTMAISMLVTKGGPLDNFMWGVHWSPRKTRSCDYRVGTLSQPSSGKGDRRLCSVMWPMI